MAFCSPDTGRNLRNGILLLSVLFLAGGAFYLNRTDPKRLTAVLLVVVGGLAWVAYQTASRQR